MTALLAVIEKSVGQSIVFIAVELNETNFNISQGYAHDEYQKQD